MMVLGTFVGALIATLASSRAAFWLGKRLHHGTYPSFILVHALTAATVVAVAAFGMADGRPPQWAAALAVYIPPVVVWLLVDLWRGHRGSPPFLMSAAT